MSLDRLILGTVALGIPYGLPSVGNAPGTTDAETAIQVMQRALAAGINRFDTAPSYGEAEARLGTALRGRGSVATKLSNLLVDAQLPEAANESLAVSLQRLQRDRVDLLQWHNWQAGLAEDHHFRACWDRLAADGRIGSLGASTYGAADALAAVRSGLFRVVQVEWNVLNQGVLSAITETAATHGVRIAVRSVFLQGVLTVKGEALPPHLKGLAEPRARADALAGTLGLTLNALALRAALDHPARPFVLIGPDREDQLEEIIGHAGLAPLDAGMLRDVADLDLRGDPLTDPRRWRVEAV